MPETFDEYQIKKGKEISKLVEDFSDVVNSMSFGKDENKKFFTEFARKHRTLQQSMFRVILNLLVQMTGDDYRTDGRNEYSKDVAQKLILGYSNQLKEEYLDAEPDRRGDEFYERRAEEIKQSCIENPAQYLGLPSI